MIASLHSRKLLLASALVAGLMATGAANAEPPAAPAAKPQTVAAAASPAPDASAPEAYVPAAKADRQAIQPAVARETAPTDTLEYVRPETTTAPAPRKEAPDAAPWPGFQRTTARGTSPDTMLSSEQLYYMEITHHAMPAVSARQRQAFERDIARAAHETRVQPALIRAVITAESSYDPTRVSAKGAVGLMQVLPDTAQRFGVRDVYNPSENIKAGTRYLAFLLRVFNNDTKLALAAYNAGEQAVIRHGNQVPPYRETINYVPRVLRFYQHYLQHPMKADFQR